MIKISFNIIKHDKFKDFVKMRYDRHWFVISDNRWVTNWTDFLDVRE